MSTHLSDSGPVHDGAASHGRRRRRDGAEANARLTGSTAAVLLVLLAAEGATILRIRPLLTPHVFIGMLLVPPVLLKMGSTIWRFARYYLGAPAYRRKGPPPVFLRLIGPVVIFLTFVVFATGIALLLCPASWRDRMLLAHKAGFIVWFAIMSFHVLGHLTDTSRLAPRDWLRRTRRQVDGAGLRQWTLAASVAVGFVMAAIVVPRVGPWLMVGHAGHH
jgi:hypothetical protein